MTEVINTLNILSSRAKGNYTLDILDADKNVILKKFIVVYVAKIFERHPAK